MKQFLLLSILFICVSTVFAQQPANDDCAGAISLTVNPTLTCTTSTNGTSVSATQSLTGCAGTADDDVWYKFTATSTSHIITATPGTISDIVLEAFSGSCGGTLTSFGCVDATKNTVAETTTLTGLTIGSVYFFRVYSFGNSGKAGTFTVCVTTTPPIPPPSNDDCSTPTNITPVTTCGAITNQTLLNTTNAGSPTNTAGTTNDVWYTFTTPANIRNIQLAFSGLGSSLSSSNTFVEAFANGSCSSGVFTGTPIGTSASGSTNLSLTNLTPSTQYYFRVFTTGTATGGITTDWGFSICVSYSAVPANDDCAGAITLTPGTTNNSGTVLNASASGTSVGCATGTPDDDVWYSFTPTQVNVSITLSSIGNTLNTSGAMIQLYQGTCGALGSVACGQNTVSASGLVTGSVYYIRVYSSGAYSATPAVGTVANTFSILVSQSGGSNVVAGRMNEVFRQTILSPANAIADPWEITYGPDNYLWITEAKGYRVFRMDPSTGTKTTVLNISQGSTFLPAADQIFNAQFNILTNNPQGGLAGLALHPGFTGVSGGTNYVYLSYIYSQTSATVFTNRLVRFTYNTSTGLLESPVSLCDTLPGSNDHNSQRMIIAKEGGVDYLFYASGDMGAGQFGNRTRPNKAQNINSYEGKILRFNLDNTSTGTGLDKWIPDDNPFNSIAPVTGKSAVWAYGIRNNQGFAYNSDLNILYGSSHGPYSDDEINIIQRDKNYGHPRVIGYAADGNYNGTTTQGLSTSYSAGSPFTDNSGVSSCGPIGNEQANADSINTAAALVGGRGAYRDPLFAAYKSTPSNIATIWSTNPGNGGWPSEGWSGLDLYTNTMVPGWKNSLIAASLKWGRLVRMKLNADGISMGKVGGQDTASYFGGTNRFRDLAFAPNGSDIYVVMDRSTTSSGPSAANPVVPACAGCVQKYTFLGYNPTTSSPFPSTIPTSIPIDSSLSAGCVSATPVTINSSNLNTSLWVPITGPEGNIIAEIDANGNNLGNITTSFFTRTGTPVRTSASSAKYLNRNVTISVQNQPSSPVSVRLYITAKELADMVATSGSGVLGINDLGIFKNNDACGTAMASVATGQTVTGRYVQSTFGHAIQFNVNSFSSFYFMSSSSTLPFELFSFSGRAVNEAAKLEWVVNGQVDVLSYTVERSLDNKHFDEAGTVSAKESQGENITYNFTDFNAGKLASTVYYRIHSNERNGIRKYTNTISINFDAIRNVFVNVFPNPVTEKTTVFINAIADETAQLKVVDNTGRIVSSTTVKLVKGKNNISLDMRSLKAGLYYLDINGKAISEKVKLIKQ